MSGLLKIRFENDVKANQEPDGSIFVEGHIARGDYDTEKAIEELTEEAVFDRVDSSAKQVMADLYELEEDEVGDLLQLGADLIASDRQKLLGYVNEDMLDAITSESSCEVHHPAFIKQALEMAEDLPESFKRAFDDDEIDHELLEALTNPEKVELMKQALGLD